MKKKKVMPNVYHNFFGIPELVTYSDCQNVPEQKEDFFQNEPVFDIGYNVGTRKNVFSYLETRIARRFVIPTCEECDIDGVLAIIHPDVRIELTDIFQLPIEQKRNLLKNSAIKQLREKKHLLDEKEVDAALKKQLDTYYDTTYKNDTVYWLQVIENGNVLIETEAGNLKKKKFHMGIYSKSKFRREHLFLCDLSLLLASILMWSETRKFLDECREAGTEKLRDNIPYKKYLQSRQLYSVNAEGIALKEKYPEVVITDIKEMLGSEITDKGKLISFRQILDLYISNTGALPLSLFLMEQYDVAIRRKFSSLSEIFLLLADNYLEEKEDFKYEAATSRTYAKSFQDKVVASRKLKREMNLTKLNRYFGKVEFDAKVDMSQILKIENAFESLNTTVFREPRLSEYSIRFRRLGCHKASGLYYPLYQCMCVDIEHPDSFCHEFFHLLDYKNGKLSKKWEFRSVYELYVSLIEEMVTSDTSLKYLRSSNRKYNLSYYKRSTEVFARCGEIYISRILGIDSILISIDENDFAYPSDPELERMIGEYFDKMFNQKREENDNGKYHRKSNSSETTKLLSGETIRC